MAAVERSTRRLIGEHTLKSFRAKSGGAESRGQAVRTFPEAGNEDRQPAVMDNAGPSSSAFDNPKRISSKISLLEKRQSIFPYYAGFSSEFAAWALQRMGARRGSYVLDPWNGSGTTTTAARALGAYSTGVDLSPVLIKVAKARLTPKSDALRLARFFSSLADAKGGLGKQPLRRLAAIYSECLNECDFKPAGPAAALALCCLFPVARRILGTHRTKNPSWYASLRPEGDLYAEMKAIEAKRIAEAVALLHTEGVPRRGPAPRLVRGDIRSMTYTEGSFDCVLTSPPYLTRLDYVQATYPELLLLAEIYGRLDLSRLRKNMIGSPLTEAIARADIVLPEAVQTVLSQVRRHSSKASATYYHRFFQGYFAGMQKALHRILPSVRVGGHVCLVVQPSYYKEVYIDLPTLMAELIVPAGFSLEAFMEFDAKNSMASVNSRARAEARKPLHETALFFSKR